MAASVPPEDDKPAPPAGLAARVVAMSGVAQASVAGLYAWAVTVAPAAWSRSGSVPAQVVATLGALALVGALALDARGRSREGRLLAVWGLVGSAALVFVLSPPRLELVRGLSGIVGWALFAYVSAAPTYDRAGTAARFDEGDELRPRAASPMGDRLYLAGAIAGAALLQLPGWLVATTERALFLRVLTVGVGVLFISHVTTVALARHKRGKPTAPKSRRRPVVIALASTLVVALLGVALALIR